MKEFNPFPVKIASGGVKEDSAADDADVADCFFEELFRAFKFLSVRNESP